MLGDGAFGTELRKRGLPVGTAPELWNFERPDDVQQVSADYFGAGADFVLTNTFGATGSGLMPRDWVIRSIGSTPAPWNWRDPLRRITAMFWVRSGRQARVLPMTNTQTSLPSK